MNKVFLFISIFTICLSCAKTDNQKTVTYGYKYFVDNEEKAYPYSSQISLYDYSASDNEIRLGDITGLGSAILYLKTGNQNSIFKIGNNDSISCGYGATYNYMNSQTRCSGLNNDFQVEITEKYVDPNPGKYSIVKGYVKGNFKGSMDMEFSGFSSLNRRSSLHGEFTVPIF